MTHVAEHCIAGPLLRRAIRPRRVASARARPRCRDRRWPEVAAALVSLRAARRCSVRIVDADCGSGALLLCAVRYARALGFTAIEARGIDDTPALVGRARASAMVLHDAAIGITFEKGDLVRALDEEADFPADIVMWHGCAGCSAEEVQAVACAGHRLIADPVVVA
ncbi:SAM-dependent methyltransferase [Sphingomonas sp. GB1N7]|uniref:SAM-dependent methyltransferase n=1 Tax=Parasphingomonas caseinilytica TaxID=3096158 RepID=UPI002FC6455E